MSPSRGTWLGLMGSGFLLGVAIHSLIPYQRLPEFLMPIVAVIGCVLFCFPRRRGTVRWIGLIILMIVLGLWRFEMVRRVIPPGLVPFSAAGLSHQSGTLLPTSSHGIAAWMWGERQALRSRANMMFTKEESSLLRGILYGDHDLSKQWNLRFRRAGLLHIIAVSGSNMTIIVVVTMFILLGLGCSRRIAFLVLTGVLILFVIFVQPSASVVRAAVMGWLLGLAPLVGRIPRPSRLLLVSAIVFVAWKPWSLFYDAGFALSFLAMWGLLTWSTYIDDRLEHYLPWDQLRGVIAATLGASIMTFPYLAWAFGQLSFFGVISSLIVVPLVPWVMATGVMALLVPQIPYIVWSAQGFLQIILRIAAFTDQLPTVLWQAVTIPFWIMLLSYYLIALLWSYTQKQRKNYPQLETAKR